MLPNKVNHEFKPNEADDIISMIKSIAERMPFLINLSPEEKQLLPRLGNKTQKFVEKTYDLAKQQPDFLPRSFSIEDMGRDLKLNSELSAILTALKILTEKVEDTYIETGSELYDAALVVYGTAKNSRIGNGLDKMVEEIGQRFAKKSRKNTDEPK
jgi:hypothetical protein